MNKNRSLALADYRALAEFRRQIRQFLHFSEIAGRQLGLEPQQYQLLLALHGLPEGIKPTVGEIASRMFIQPNSAVELINRLEKNGIITRHPGETDKREVWLKLTATGRAVLRKLVFEHREQLERTGPELIRALTAVLSGTKLKDVA